MEMMKFACSLEVSLYKVIMPNLFLFFWFIQLYHPLIVLHFASIELYMWTSFCNYIVPLHVTIHTILICTSQINNNYCFPSILAHRLKKNGLYPLGSFFSQMIVAFLCSNKNFFSYYLNKWMKTCYENYCHVGICGLNL